MGIIIKKDCIIGWDYGTEDYNCMVFGYYNKKGEYVIDRVDYNKKGGVKMNNMNYKDTMTYQVAMNDFDEMCEMSYNKMIKKLMKDPLIKKIAKELNEKEVKRMKYFDVKVVKVKRNRKEHDKKYYQEHREHIIERVKKYHQDHNWRTTVTCRYYNHKTHYLYIPSQQHLTSVGL